MARSIAPQSCLIGKREVAKPVHARDCDSCGTTSGETSSQPRPDGHFNVPTLAQVVAQFPQVFLAARGGQELTLDA